MDLAKINPQIAAEAGAFLHLEHPVTGEPLYTEDGQPIGMHALGADSGRFRQKSNQQANARVARLAKRKPVTVEQQQVDECELLASVVTKCVNMVVDGEVSTPQNIAEQMYHNLWIKEQLDLHVGRRQNFTQESGRTSVSSSDSSPGGAQATTSAM